MDHHKLIQFPVPGIFLLKIINYKLVTFFPGHDRKLKDKIEKEKVSLFFRLIEIKKHPACNEDA